MLPEVRDLDLGAVGTQSVESEPLSRKAYVVICLLLPGPLTFTGTTLRQTLGRPFPDVSAGADSLNVVKMPDSVAGWMLREEFDLKGAVAVPPTELWFSIIGSSLTLFCFTAGLVVFWSSGG